MQKLAPEMKKLQEKLQGRQARPSGMAQMELYRKHGVNPFGTCWFLLLQMPVFMGLYFSSAGEHRLPAGRASGRPGSRTWRRPTCCSTGVTNIPWISRPEDYGSIIYLGPYLQPAADDRGGADDRCSRRCMTPPPTDEQQEMQQKMMKYMMIFFGLMFYNCDRPKRSACSTTSNVAFGTSTPTSTTDVAHKHRAAGCGIAP